MTTLDEMAARAAQDRLAILGGFVAAPGDDLPPGTRTVLLLGPAEPGYWAHVTAQPEWGDGAADPVDRWSRRAVGRIACDLGAKALFPFGGPPFRPFFSWALRSGRVWASPVRLLVHAEAGLMVSFRGALALREPVAPPPPLPRPCDGCPAPCLTACPAGALTGAGYDLPACHAYLDSAPGSACMTGGCRVRNACPVAQNYGRLPEHSAYHMRQFHR